MVEERRSEFSNLQDTEYKAGDTIVVLREDVQTFETSHDPQEQAYNQFLTLIAEDTNIMGVAISSMTYGGIYTDWFVREITGDKMRASLDNTGRSYKLLREAFGKNAGYGSFWPMHERTFEEAEAIFRERWTTPDDGPFSFSGRPHGEGLELIGIIKFE